jgi:cbb3-type cytochrome oxidase subunit 3
MMDFIVEHARLGSLLFFFTFFVGMIVWMYLPGQKARFDREKRRILETSDE